MVWSECDSWYSSFLTPYIALPRPVPTFAYRKLGMKSFKTGRKLCELTRKSRNRIKRMWTWRWGECDAWSLWANGDNSMRYLWSLEATQTNDPPYIVLHFIDFESQIANDSWDKLGDGFRGQMAKMSCSAAWGLQQWDKMEKFVHYLPEVSWKKSFVPPIFLCRFRWSEGLKLPPSCTCFWSEKKWWNVVG